MSIHIPTNFELDEMADRRKHGELLDKIKELELYVSNLKISAQENLLTLNYIAKWSKTYGAALCPGTRPDTFGEGMREAKEQIKSILYRKK